MSLVDQIRPSFSLPAGVHVSQNARVILSNYAVGEGEAEEYELIRCQRAVVRWSNNLGFYLQTGKQTGTVYTGPFDVSGALTRSYINRLEERLVIGLSGEERETAEQLSDIIPTVANPDFGSGWGRADMTRYMMNNLMVELELDPDGYSFGPIRLRVHKVLFSTGAIAFDANSLIRSGPLDFIGSWISIYKPPTET